MHLAGRVTIKGRREALTEAINVGGVANVVDACLSSGVRRLVHMSSIHALSPYPVDEPLDEGNQLVDEDGRRHPPYDFSKAGGEREIQRGLEAGLDAVIVSPAGVLGPYDFKPSHTGQLVALVMGRRLPSLADGGYAWVDARDVADATIAAMDKGVTGEKYLLASHWVSIRELGHMVARFAGVAPPRLTAPTWLAKVGVPFVWLACKAVGIRPLYTIPSLTILRTNAKTDCSRARDVLGFQGRPFEETIRDTVRWWKETGLVRPPKGGWPEDL